MTKTPMTILRENIKESQVLSKAAKLIVCAFIDNQLEEEKKAIEYAFNSGAEEESNFRDGETYYQSTYQNNQP